MPAAATLAAVARKLRNQSPGVMNGSDRRADIFADDQDRQCFVATLSETCEKTDKGAVGAAVAAGDDAESEVVGQETADPAQPELRL